MDVSILHPELLNITDTQTGKTYFGGDQEWYANEWHKRAGCGPTCAANVTAYLAKTRPGMQPLYGGDMSLAGFSRHMEEVYAYVTPGTMGLNRTEMFSEGIVRFAQSRGVALTPHVFDVSGYAAKNRPPVSSLGDFVKAGLLSDCPIGFLNLTRGRVKNIQGWHWITVFNAKVDGDTVFTCASDEGKEVCFDLKLWYLSTRMRGGLVYFTDGAA